ncbi:hypothetical protein ACIBH1_45720 [Nonomuraea sp. NPDC050663]|uniref:hypothetical protein n=1 Tax=Nonomuraea sp. NPDC050663 TaxID=3364370 RepID=UPI0037B2DC66
MDPKQLFADDAETTAKTTPKTGAEPDEQVADVYHLRPGTPAPAERGPGLPARALTFVAGPVALWVGRDRPSYLAPPVRFVAERWTPSWSRKKAGFLLWSHRVLLLLRAALYTLLYLPSMVLVLPELLAAAIIAALILLFLV